jgi:glycosyltransferase involved in cell wall biosynthesis
VRYTLLVATINEIEGMRAIMPKVKPEWVDQILVSDYQSTDGTPEYARELGYEVVQQVHPGARFAYIDALPRAIGDVIIPFSPDGNCVPEVIPELRRKIEEGYDMVVASRYLDGLKSEDDGVVTGFGNSMFTGLINRLHRGHYTDAMGMYRAWRKDMFYDLELDKDEGYAPEKYFGTVLGVEPLLSVRVAKRRLRYTEVPGPEPARIGGKSKLKIVRWGGGYLGQIVRELWNWR